MKNKAPAFQLYSKDLLTDEQFILMTAEERGVFLSALAYEWIEGSIPGDPLLLARLVNLKPEEVERCWPALLKKFLKKKNQSDRLVNQKMEMQRKIQKLHSQKQARSGHKGGLARWQKHNNDAALESKPNRVAIASPRPASASASASAISSSLRSEEKKGNPAGSRASRSASNGSKKSEEPPDPRRQPLIDFMFRDFRERTGLDLALTFEKGARALTKMLHDTRDKSEYELDRLESAWTALMETDDSFIQKQEPVTYYAQHLNTLLTQTSHHQSSLPLRTQRNLRAMNNWLAKHEELDAKEGSDEVL